MKQLYSVLIETFPVTWQDFLGQSLETHCKRFSKRCFHWQIGKFKHCHMELCSLQNDLFDLFKAEVIWSCTDQAGQVKPYLEELRAEHNRVSLLQSCVHSEFTIHSRHRLSFSSQLKFAKSFTGFVFGNKSMVYVSAKVGSNQGEAK